MQNDADLIIEIWSRMKPFVTAKDRLDAADALVVVFDDFGMTDGFDDHQEAMDKQLGAAIHSRFGLDEEEEDDADFY